MVEGTISEKEEEKKLVSPRSVSSDVSMFESGVKHHNLKCIL